MKTNCPYCNNNSFDKWSCGSNEVSYLTILKYSYFNRCFSCKLWSRFNPETEEQEPLPEELRNMDQE